MQSPATNRAATQQLPAGYTPQRVFALNSTRVQVLMNLAGLVLLIGAGLLFVTLFRVLRPEDLGPALSVQVGEIGDLARVLAVTALVLVLMVVLHEAVHGAFFWLFTRSRPVFAFKGAYAYAAAPGWFIPRNQYLVVGLSPLVILTVVGVALAAVLPAGWLLPLLALLILNASGAVGDLWVTLSLLGYPPSAYCYDEGDRTTVYLRDEA